MSTETTITLLERIDELKEKLLAEQVKTAGLEDEVRRLEANQRPKDRRKCGYCGWEQIMVSGEWKCGSCSKQKQIDDLGKKFALEIADMRMRLSTDSRKLILDLEAKVRELNTSCNRLHHANFNKTYIIINLKIERDKLLSLLRKYQWAGWTHDLNKDGHKILVAGEICFCCKEDKIRGHKPDCAIGNALKENK